MTKTTYKTTIISSRSFLSFTFFERQRHWKRSLKIPLNTLTAPYLGLHVFCHKPEFEFKSVLNFKRIDYMAEITETFSLILLQLYFNETIDIKRFLDQKSYLNGFVKIHIDDYQLGVLSDHNHEDLLTNIFIKVIKRTRENYPLTQNLDMVIDQVIGQFLGWKREYSKPGKSCLLEILKLYDSSFSWFSLNIEQQFFGIQKIYDPEIKNPDILIQILKQSELSRTAKELSLYNIDYRRLKDTIEKHVFSNLKKRESESTD